MRPRSASERHDDDLKGGGNSYDYGARFYDPRRARFLSLDPLRDKFPWQSGYVYAGDNPIYFIDGEGKQPNGSQAVRYANSPNGQNFVRPVGYDRNWRPPRVTENFNPLPLIFNGGGYEGHWNPIRSSPTSNIGPGEGVVFVIQYADQIINYYNLTIVEAREPGEIIVTYTPSLNSQEGREIYDKEAEYQKLKQEYLDNNLKEFGKTENDYLSVQHNKAVLAAAEIGWLLKHPEGSPLEQFDTQARKALEGNTYTPSPKYYKAEIKSTN